MTVIAMIKNTKTDLIARMTPPDPLTVARKQPTTAIDTNKYLREHKLAPVFNTPVRVYTCHEGQKLKKPPSKQEIRRRLERQTRSFLNGGGEIESVPLGVSAVDEAISPIKTPIFSGKPQTRTPVTDVIETLRRRREAQLRRKPQPVRKRKHTRRKQVMYDDFGEPLRVVYHDE